MSILIADVQTQNSLSRNFRHFVRCSRPIGCGSASQDVHQHDMPAFTLSTLLTLGIFLQVLIILSAVGLIFIPIGVVCLTASRSVRVLRQQKASMEIHNDARRPEAF